MARWGWLAWSLTAAAILVGSLSSGVWGQRASTAPIRDAIAEAQAPPAGAPAPLPQDRGDRFEPGRADPSSSALDGQPDKGQATGFDFVRDPLNAKRPMQTFDEVMKADVADKAKVMAAQRKLLETRYVLAPRLDSAATMSRGKALPVGPTARLASGMTWEELARLGPDEIKRQVFPSAQTRMFPRLERQSHAGREGGPGRLPPDTVMRAVAAPECLATAIEEA